MLHRTIPVQPNTSPLAIESSGISTLQSHNSLFDSSSSSRHDGELAETRHRSPSWAAQTVHARDKPVKMIGTTSGTSLSTPTGSSGRPGGRALPPPRFQRKQRPPRVQQALAANGNGSTNTRNSTAGVSSSRRGSGRHAANVNAQTSAAGNSGTLTLGPVTNWGTGTSSVVSLSMAAVNAASARGSVLHQTAASSSRSLMHDNHDMSLMDPVFVVSPDAQLDPVQLHNRITFGMGHPTSLDGYHPDAAIHHTAVLSGLVDPSELALSNQLSSFNTRARSQSHHGVQPTYRSQQPVLNLSTGLGAFGDLGALGIPAHLRTRSRSLVSPADLIASGQSTMIPPLPNQQDVGSDLRTTTTTSNMGAQFTGKKPLKSALKVRKSAPELEGRTPNTLAIPPVPYAPAVDSTTAALSDLDYYGFSSTRASPPESSLNLPDNLQQEYAQQLKLLQQEYTIKAVRAERTRQRSLERTRTPGSASRTAPVVERDTSVASSKEVSFHDQVEVMDLVRQNSVKAGVTRTRYESWSEQWSPVPAIPAYAQMEEDGSSSLDVDSEAEIGSNVGDRGHEDHFKDLHEEYPPPSHVHVEWSSPSVSSSAAPLPSPSGAVSHGTDSPLTDSIPPLDTMPSIQVEVIAPTPEMQPVELAVVDEHVPRPLADGAHPEIHEPNLSTTEESNTAQQASPRTSAESSGSSDSNKTILRLEPTPDVEAPVMQMLDTDAQGAHDAETGVARHVPMLESATELVDDDNTARNLPSSVPTASVQGIVERSARGMSNALSLGSTDLSHPNQRPSLQTSVFAPVSMLPDVTSPTDSHSNSTQSFSDEPPPRWDLEDRSRLSSIPSVSSLSSGGTGHDRFGESHRTQGRLDPSRQRSMSALSPPATGLGSGSRGSHASSHVHDDGSAGQFRSRVGLRSILSINEMSSAASVESGSSHGAASGASHPGRSYERSMTGSQASHSSSGYGYQDNRARASSTASRRSNLSDAVPITAGMRQMIQDLQRSSVHPQMPNMPSVDSIGNSSGRTGGSTGNALHAASRGLGGDSIWTLGKEEGARWPAPPSSSGHSSAPSVQQTYQYAPKSLGPEAPSIVVTDSQANFHPFDYDYDATAELSEFQHPYNRGDRFPAGNAALPDTRPMQYSQIPPRNHGHLSYAHPAVQNPALLGYPDPSLGYGQSMSSPTFAYYEDESVPVQVSVMLSPYELEQLRALRSSQMRAQAAPFTPSPPSTGYSQKRLPAQASSRSLPAMGSGITPQYQSQQSPVYVPDMPTGRPSSASRPSTGSRPSTALTGKSSHSGDSGETIGRRNVVALPASGGVFPRYQEFNNPYPDASVRPGSSSGRFKSLFKSRDSRVFK